MRPFAMTQPPVDDGYPFDSDLHQMSDDGGPVGPDPARWGDPAWRDDLADGATLPDMSPPPAPGRAVTAPLVPYPVGPGADETLEADWELVPDERLNAVRWAASRLAHLRPRLSPAAPVAGEPPAPHVVSAK